MEDIKGGNVMKHDYSNILNMLKKRVQWGAKWKYDFNYVR